MNEHELLEELQITRERAQRVEKASRDRYERERDRITKIIQQRDEALSDIIALARMGIEGAVDLDEAKQYLKGVSLLALHEIDYEAWSDATILSKPPIPIVATANEDWVKPDEDEVCQCGRLITNCAPEVCSHPYATQALWGD